MENEEIQKVQDEIKSASGFVENLKAEVNRFMVGQDVLLHGLLVGMISNGHILVEGLPGLAKTLAIRLMAEATGAEFSRIQFTPDLLPADVIGTNVYDPREHSFSIKKGPVFANLVLADEINRAPAKVQSALLEAMQERQVTVGGETHRLPAPFLVMATQNPIEQEGTYPLPEAQVDRFMLKIEIDYPARSEESQILERMGNTKPDVNAIKVVDLNDIVSAQKLVDKVYIDAKIQEYILDIVFATRRDMKGQLSERQSGAKLDDFDVLIQHGASPRATLSLAVAAKANAFLNQRAYVVPQDIKDMALHVMCHRMVPSYEAEAENLTSSDLLKRLLDELRTP